MSNKKIELKLVKTGDSISVINEEESSFDAFQDDETGRKAFVMHMLDEFINKEVEGGRE